MVVCGELDAVGDAIRHVLHKFGRIARVTPAGEMSLSA
jgi:hypothetical protein